MNPKKTIAALASTAVLAGAGLAATAQAETVKVTGGETELKPAKSTVEVLDELGIGIEGTAYAVKGGQYDFASIADGGGGVLKHSGKLTFVADEADTELKLKGFEIDLAGDLDDGDTAERAKDDQGVLTAKVCLLYTSDAADE